MGEILIGLGLLSWCAAGAMRVWTYLSENLDLQRVADARSARIRETRTPAADEARPQPLPRSRQKRLERVVAMVRGEAELEHSAVDGHVSWRRGGRRFYYFEKLISHSWWSIVQVRHPKGRLPAFQVRPRDGQAPFARPPKPCTADTGSPAFHGKFEVCLPEHAAAGELPVRKESLLRLLTLDSLLDAPPLLEAHLSRCQVCIPGILVEHREPQKLIEEAMRLLEIILGQSAPIDTEDGMQLLDALAITEAGQAICPVCAERIVDAAVECARCGTPHHADCWSYTGACAIYGCLSNARK